MSGKKALIVGIDDYPQGRLNGCCNDANDVGKLLSRNGDGSKNFQVVIKNNICTKADLKKNIKQCFSGDADVALFYFSGHGCIDSIGGYLVTPDYLENDYGVSLEEILTIINNSKCRNKVVILDCCYSGFMGNLKITEQQNTSVISEGVTILTSSRSSEPSIETNGHGVFTSLLLEGLSGCASDVTGHITPGGIYAYIDKALGLWEQRPVFKTNVTEFTCLRTVVPQVDVKIIRKICEYFQYENSELPIDPSFEPTNSPSVEHELIEPYADPDNVRIFSDLQKMEGVGLVIPVGEEHMYFAAMKSKKCALTSMGKQYWRLVKKDLI